jgi:hypothetical protein
MSLEKTCPEEMIHFTCCSDMNLTSFSGSKILQIWHELPKLVITSLTNAWITMYTAVAIALLCLFYCVGPKSFMSYIDWSSKTLYMLGPFNKVWFLLIFESWTGTAKLEKNCPCLCASGDLLIYNYFCDDCFQEFDALVDNYNLFILTRIAVNLGSILLITHCSQDL